MNIIFLRMHIVTCIVIIEIVRVPLAFTKKKEKRKRRLVYRVLGFPREVQPPRRVPKHYFMEKVYLLLKELHPLWPHVMDM